MEEVKRALEIVQGLRLAEPQSALVDLLRSNNGSVELDSLEVYFNRNPQHEQVDLAIGSYVFNLAEWKGSEHKLSELLLLKGAALSDLERLHELVTQKRVDRS